jgi:hypothetical protein
MAASNVENTRIFGYKMDKYDINESKINQTSPDGRQSDEHDEPASPFSPLNRVS